ncbi:TP53-binding protein 1-like isoform X2 [Athalia rosae]|uniref:TP53-binding protein 1-like isoform X2 n=1 Tax=Athalia rosae TaxID=37344 RepID=UPI00203474AB|nr:TP53-binding protein 1-like isoform X2 [Athalia rosae]
MRKSGVLCLWKCRLSLLKELKMSKTPDIEKPVPDSQETYYDKSQNIDNSQMFNESQDFALIVAEDSDESTKNRSPIDNELANPSVNENLEETEKIKRQTDIADINQTAPIIEEKIKDVVNEADETKENDTMASLKMQTDSDDSKSKEKSGSDDDEIIQGTPPEIWSPSRKLLSGTTAGKRKAEPIDEPLAKIPRTLSEEDAFKLDKEEVANRISKSREGKKLIFNDVQIGKKESQTDIICENTEQIADKDGQQIDSCVVDAQTKKVIIEETQTDIICENTEQIDDKDDQKMDVDAQTRKVVIEETQTDVICENTEQIDDKDNQRMDSCAVDVQPKKVIIQESQDVVDSEPITSTNGRDKDKNVSSDVTQKITENPEIVADQTNSESDVSSTKPDSSENNISPLIDSQAKDVRQKKITLPKSPEKKTKVTTNGDSTEKAVCNVPVESIDITETDGSEETTGNVKKISNKQNESASEPEKCFWNTALPTTDSNSDSNFEPSSNGSNKSRRSVEVIFDRKSSSQEKKKCQEWVQIDEEGEKIVLDSSAEDFQLRMSTGSSTHSPKNSTIYKSCLDAKSHSESSYKSANLNEAQGNKEWTESSSCQITNGEEDLAGSGTTKSVSIGSDVSMDDATPEPGKRDTTKPNPIQSETVKISSANPKLNDSVELANLVSDSEGDSLVINERVENKTAEKITVGFTKGFAANKTTAFEKRMRFYVELKYLLHVDDGTKEIVGKEITDVQCEPIFETAIPRRNSDASGCLADISGNENKDTSPGSVISNPQLFPLLPSRFSIASTVSSSSSVSSAASLAAKLLKDGQFSLPKGRAKHAKRPATEPVLEDHLNLSGDSKKSTHGWNNAQLILDTLLSSAGTIISSPDILQCDEKPEKIEDQVLSSTPEPIQDEQINSQEVTPKSTRAKKPLKRIRTKSNTSQSNAIRKASPEVISTSQEDRVPIPKKTLDNVDSVQSEQSSQIGILSTPSKLTARSESLRSLTPQNLLSNELVGKVVFARWSDHNYYPGEVIEKTKDKYRVKFYDGKTKLMIEDFIIPMPEVLKDGWSVYATTEEDDYGSIGMIRKSENVDNVLYYTIEMDDGKTVRVEVKDIFLMPGQAEVLREDFNRQVKNLPKTPQHLGQVSLDNLVDGKRRSRRAITPTISTPKSKKITTPRVSKLTDLVTPSGSGVSNFRLTLRELSSSGSETKATDSNVSWTEDVDGVQPELVEIPAAQVSKGPSNRMKGKGRSKSKQQQNDAELGPIPSKSSTIFKNMTFILTCTSSDLISRRQTDDSCSETGTENEEDWRKIPFIKERIQKQLTSGGGKVYDSFKLIPQSEYKNTKLITNVPNLTAKSVQCMSVGIPTCSHNWVINCCKENKTLSVSDYALPVGLSIVRNKYIELWERPNKEPFNGMVIGIPMLDNRNVAKRSVQFWSRICENAGAVVQVIEDTDSDLCNLTAVLADNRCPNWIVEKACDWQIPLVSTVWIVQCLIEGRLVLHDSHPEFSHMNI